MVPGLAFESAYSQRELWTGASANLRITSWKNTPIPDEVRGPPDRKRGFHLIVQCHYLTKLSTMERVHYKHGERSKHCREDIEMGGAWYRVNSKERVET